MPFNRQINKLWYIQRMEYHSAIKINKLSIHTTSMNLKCIILREGSQTQKATNSMYPFIWEKCKDRKTN